MLFFAGPPYVRPMPNVSAVAGEPLYIPCPVAGYPIDSITWEKGIITLKTRLLNLKSLSVTMDKLIDQNKIRIMKCFREEQNFEGLYIEVIL